MSLRDAGNKMSKSDVSKYSRILLTDSNDEISTKINKAKSDSMNMPHSEDELRERNEINNLITIYCSISNQTKSSIIDMFAGKEISHFKAELKAIVIDLIEPISQEIKKIKDDKKYLKKILDEGSSKAKERADKTIAEVNQIMGFSFE